MTTNPNPLPPLRDHGPEKEVPQFTCDFCQSPAVSMVGESNEILVCVYHGPEKEAS